MSLAEPRRAALLALVVDASDAPYPLGPVAEEKVFGQGVGGPPEHLLHEQGGRLLGAAVVCGRFLRLLAVDRASRRHGIGSALLSRAEEAVRARGERTITVGGEPGNYFVPGVLASDADARRFFERRGYTVADEPQHLVADLGDLAGRPTLAAPPGVVIERASQATRAAIEAFVSATFSEGWRFEVSHAFAAPSPPLFAAWRDGAVVGFSAHDVNNRGLGFYGPAGVHPAERGAGLGAALLRASLADLAARGHARTIIPWVSTVDFYRKVAGARVAERFALHRKAL